MRYMMLIYSREEEALTQQEMEDLKRRHEEVIRETAKAGIFRGAEPLQPTSTATTLRLEDSGNVLTTDGPFAETKEQLAGYYILDCKDLDEAIYWGSKIPTSCKGRKGCLEIRPLHDMTSRAIAQMAEEECSASSRG